MQTDFRTFAKSISTLFSPEIQENIFFYVGDCLLYFNLAYRHKERLKYLVPGREGSGFLLEEAIKRRHKPFIKWLLNFKSFPNEYLLVSAVCHGDLSILIQIITFIGEDYKEHDTHAKIICVREGKMEMLEYLFGRNKTFHCSSTDLRKYIIEGFYNSAELYNWYLKNKKYCPLIAESICLRGLLLNNDITRAKKLLKNNKVATLIAALSSTYSAKEKTYRWIIRTYPNEEKVLTHVAKACTLAGYVDTLEKLFNAPYNVHVECDMFVDIPNEAVAKILHKYAYKRNQISHALSICQIQELENRFSTYKDSISYLELLRSVTLGRKRYEPYFARRQPEDVVMYLVDLGQENFDTWLLQQYIQYALDCGYPLLLRMLMPSLPRNQIKSLNTSTICYYQNLDMVECVLGLGIVQTLSFRNVTSIPSPSIIRNLIERNVVVSNDSNLLKWSQETEFAIQQEIVADYLKLKRDPPTPETLLTLVHSIHRSIPSKLHLKSQLEDAHISKQDTRFALGDALGFDPPLYGYFSDYEYLFSEDSRSILQRVNLLILLKELDPDRHTRNDVSINYKLSCANSINQIQ